MNEFGGFVLLVVVAVIVARVIATIIVNVADAVGLVYSVEREAKRHAADLAPRFVP